MKTTIKLLLALIILIPAGSCKKGEEDPFISFRSRKKRITGRWNYTSYKLDNEPSLEYTVQDSYFDDNCNANVTETYKWEQKLGLELKEDKQFIFNAYLWLDYDKVYQGQTICSDEHLNQNFYAVEDGTWELAGDKDKLVLYYDDSLNTMESYDVIRLSNKELKLSGVINGSSVEIFAEKN